MRVGHLLFDHVSCVDFEFHQPDGERPVPLCAVALDAATGQVRRWWQEQLYTYPAAPYPCGPRDLLVAFVASAELSCHLALGWPLPDHVLDLYVEFSAATNGLPRPHGRSLLGALLSFGLDAMSAVEKAEMRGLAIRGGPFTAQERADLLDYCEADVHALAALLPRLFP